MLSREETLRRIEKIEEQITELKEDLRDDLPHVPMTERTRAFLECCGGWEDSRTPEETIADIRASRANSTRVPTFCDEDER